MDPNPIRPARGRARGPSQGLPPNQSGQPQQFRGPRPIPPSLSQARNIPRQSGPRQAFRPQCSVQQVTSELARSTTGDDVPMPVGRGATRGRQEPIPYYRNERPESSKTSVGKEGSGGQPIQLIANYFPITTYTNWSLYQYQVKFEPEIERISTKRGLLSRHRERLGLYIFDGTMLFSRNKYEPDTFDLTSILNTDDTMVTVKVKYTTTVERGDYASIQVFNILLRRCLRKLNLTLVGRNFYDAEAKINIHQHKLQLWPGYETTIGMFDSGLLLRSEITTKVMREETVLDFLKECAANRRYDVNWMNTFKMGVLGSVVLTRYNNQTYRIDDIDEESNIQSTFRLRDGTAISYVDYYKQKHDIDLSGQPQPLLMSKKRKALRMGNDDSEVVYLIPELCTLTGMTEAMRRNDLLKSTLAEYTRVGPSERISRYYSFINRIHSTPESGESLTDWNLTLSNRLISIPARVLPQETLQGNNHKYPSGIKADWTTHLRQLPMFTNALIQRWVILTPGMFSSEVRNFTKTLLQVARAMSFNLPAPEIVEMSDTNKTAYINSLERIVNEINPSFILCVTRTASKDLYICIKRYLCINRSVPSQVVLLRQIQKNNMSVCTKIAIQINCKLGGAPWRVVIPEKNMMIVGFDVNHDVQNKNKSYGALIATMNDSHTSYFSCVQPHERGQELSSYFAMSVAKALHKYKSKNNRLPNSIVIYRDGVGDGQLTYVHKTEVDMVKKICKDFYGENKVGLAFIIVKKRIGTRFFCNSNTPRSYQNPPPGTVVDNTVTDPTMYDFYLVSQNVTKGTVTPTHYNVIMDTLSETTAKQITPEIMQKLTYKLTHMYYNWSGTVRVPAPCQLAHKLAFLTGQYLNNPANSGLEDLLYFL